MRRFRLVMMSLLTLFLAFGVLNVQSLAESKYTKVYAYSGKVSIKKGKYRLEYKSGKTLDSASLKIWRGKKQVKNFKNVGYYIVLNDEKIYFVRKNAIMELSLENMKVKPVVSLSMEPDICDIKENTVFYTMYPNNSEAEQACFLYSYDMETKETLLLSKNAGNCYLGEEKLACTPATFDVSPTALFSMDYDGENVKKLADYVLGTKVIDNKLYYCGYPSYYPMKGYIYCCNFDGSDKKKLSKKKIEAHGILDITKKDVTFLDGNFQKKKLNFETGKIVKVK